MLADIVIPIVIRAFDCEPVNAIGFLVELFEDVLALFKQLLDVRAAQLLHWCHEFWKSLAIARVIIRRPVRRMAARHVDDASDVICDQEVGVEDCVKAGQCDSKRCYLILQGQIMGCVCGPSVRTLFLWTFGSNYLVYQFILFACTL